MREGPDPWSHPSPLCALLTLGEPQHLKKIRSSPYPGKVCPPLSYSVGADCGQLSVVRTVTATTGSDVVQSGRPIFDDLSNICGRISAITRRMLSSKWSSVCGLSA
ncbi:hypothetical protein TNCV_1919251 [Trichonephila clavipes]|nr:hypothetical protein TNCV_1919251 [Trichonephila clavipes]